MRSYPVVLGFDVARLAHWTRRTRDLVISATTCVRLASGLLTGRARELWLGDSHAVYFNRGFVTANVLAAGRGVYVVHLGSRLMFSVAHKGFPLWAERILRAAGAVGWRRGTPIAVLCLGEIDVRCHLAEHGVPGAWPMEFVTEYVQRAVRTLRSHGFRRVVFMVPPPPCLDHLSVGHLPVVGDHPTRMSAWDALRAELRTAVDRYDEDVALVDATSAILDPATGIRPDLTDDQCHVNATGRHLVRQVVDRQLVT